MAEEVKDDVHLVQLLFNRPGGAVWLTIGAAGRVEASCEAARAYRDMPDPETGDLALGVRIWDIRRLSDEERSLAMRELTRLRRAR